MLNKLKLFFYKLNLKWTERDIKDIQAWLDGVTVDDNPYLIIDAKEQQVILRRDRLDLNNKIKQLEKR